MGVVYKAKRHEARPYGCGPQVSRPPTHFESRSPPSGFVQEAKAASALDHPNIGYIHEINETEDGQLFIAMAYYEGETLKDKIAQWPDSQPSRRLTMPCR